MYLHRAEDIKALSQGSAGSIIGVGMTAFPRIGPAFFLDSYHIIALSKTADLRLLRRRADIFCLEEAGGGLPTDSRHSGALLAHAQTKDYLKGLPDPKHLLLYQSYPELEDLAEEEGWILLANPSALRLRLRERAFFQEMAGDLDLCQVPGTIWPAAVLHEKSYTAWARELGPEIVIQLPDIAQGGGRGTFFIRSTQDYDRLRERLKGNVWRGAALKTILVRRLIRGTPASIAVCVTQQGILISGLQKQLIDLPYCSNVVENGIFCGHVWDEIPWDPMIRDAALSQAQKIGDYVAVLGYRGILGIDVVIDEGAKAVYPIEINPRFTGAFPMLSFLHKQNGIIPLDMFHLVAFLNLPCQFDVAQLNRQYQLPLKGSHLLLFLPPYGSYVRGFDLRPGVYETRWKGQAIRFVKDGIEYADIQNENQFAVVDGPPAPEAIEKRRPDPFYRLCHVLFPCPVADAQGGLTPHACRVLDWIYESSRG